jgi:hypothetical protein
MRHVVASLLVVTCFAPETLALQSGSGAAPGRNAVSACSLLTKELVTQVTPYDKQAFAAVMLVPPMEDSVGPSGSACSYGGITMQIDPFAPAVFEKQRDKTWALVPNVGDGAYFRDNKGRWAELYARTGARVLTIQMDVPTGRTAASIQPNTIALANALLPKLK